MKDRVGIWTIRPDALPLGRYLERSLPGTRVEAPAHAGVSGNRNALRDAFRDFPQWVWVMTTGIAVRYLDGILADKKTDPGVVVIDEAARFAVSLVGGHEGGANALAYRVAARTGATPVVTTATETWKPLVVGIGTRKGIPEERIAEAITAALHEIDYPIEAVRELATIREKAAEPGLEAWARRNAIPLRVFSRQQLQDRQWARTPSPWVQANLGVGGVCEPCCLVAAPRARLILPKWTRQGVAVAVAADAAPWEEAENASREGEDNARHSNENEMIDPADS